ncbi:MAG: response regulator transcription factor [Firmicutes bacterium]|nr:response regulator transcription factor [Bacillota bacterium]
MRLLLAEDEKSLARAVSTILQKNNYSVDVVDNGLDVLDYAEAAEYDCIILDIMMPLMDGITALKELRKRGNNVPVIMLTAKSELDDKITGLDSGANDYLTKPFEVKELMARIRAVTRVQWQQKDSKLTFGNLTLDCAAYEVSTPSGKEQLTNKEFQLLEMLMRDPKVKISTDTLMERIWGFESESETNVIWVHISYLRKKLKKMEANVEIKAARNFGYYLEVNE